MVVIGALIVKRRHALWSGATAPRSARSHCRVLCIIFVHRHQPCHHQLAIDKRCRSYEENDGKLSSHSVMCDWLASRPFTDDSFHDYGDCQWKYRESGLSLCLCTEYTEQQGTQVGPLLFSPSESPHYRKGELS